MFVLSESKKSCPFLSEVGQKDNLVKKVDNVMSEDVQKFQKGICCHSVLIIEECAMGLFRNSRLLMC